MRLLILFLLFPAVCFAVSDTAQFVGQNDYPDGSGRYAEFEREIQDPGAPTAGHGVDCDTSNSQTNSQDSNEYFVTPNGTAGSNQWSAIDGATSFTPREIFVCPGTYTGNTDIQIRFSGTDSGGDNEHDSSWVTVVWWDDDESDDGDNPLNWNAPGSPGAGPERAVIPRMEFYDVDAWMVQGMTHVGTASDPNPITFTLGSTDRADNIIINRGYINPTYLASTNNADGVLTSGGNDYITVQNSVVRGCGYEPDVDDVALSWNSTDWARFVNNEVSDCSDLITGGCTICTTNGFVIENNDLYFTSASYTTLDGAAGVDESPTTPPAGSGDYSCRENHIDVKGASPADTSAANRAYIIGNRFWGNKPGFAGSAACTCGSSGDYNNRAVQFFENVRNVYVANNIFHEMWVSTVFFASTNSGGSNISVNGNIVHTITNIDGRASGTGGTCGTTAVPIRTSGFDMPVMMTNSEFRFNSIIDVKGSSGSGTNYWMYDNSTSSIDMECNMIIDSDDWGGAGPSTGFINDNSFIGTTVKTVSTETLDNFSATLTDWAASTSYSAGDMVSATSGSACSDGTQAQCFKYFAETAGTSGASQPSWTTTLGDTTTDNTVTWRAVLKAGSYLRKGWSGPETKWLPYVIPWYDPSISSDWDDQRVCAGQTVGDRTGYGVDNQTY